MTAISPASPARAGADDDESNTPPETPQQALSALCADIDFNDDLPQATNLGHGILTLLQLPALRALPKTPLEETILGLKVEVERLVEELDLLRSRSELRTFWCEALLSTFSFLHSTFSVAACTGAGGADDGGRGYDAWIACARRPRCTPWPARALAQSPWPP